MTARWSDPHRLPGSTTACGPGYGLHAVNDLMAVMGSCCPACQRIHRLGWSGRRRWTSGSSARGCPSPRVKARRMS